MLNSGNRLAALQDRGQGYAQGWQNQIFNQLLGNVGAANNVDTLGLNAQNQGMKQLFDLSGAGRGDPGLAAQLLQQGRQNQQANIGQGIGGVANGVAGIAGPAWKAIQSILSGSGGSIDLTQGGGNIGATDDWIAQNVYGIGGGGGSGMLPDPSDILGGSDFTDLFGGASGFDIYG